MDFSELSLPYIFFDALLRVQLSLAILVLQLFDLSLSLPQSIYILLQVILELLLAT